MVGVVAADTVVGVVAADTAEGVDTRLIVVPFAVDSLDLGGVDRLDSDADSPAVDSLVGGGLDIAVFGWDVLAAVVDCKVDFAE